MGMAGTVIDGMETEGMLNDGNPEVADFELVVEGVDDCIEAGGTALVGWTDELAGAAVVVGAAAVGVADVAPAAFVSPGVTIVPVAVGVLPVYAKIGANSGGVESAGNITACLPSG